MFSYRCLICYTEVATSSVDLTKQSSDKDDKVLSSLSATFPLSPPSSQVSSPKQCHQLFADVDAIFTLRNLLEVPQGELANHLVNWGSPSEWIRCCERCQEAVITARRFHQQILETSWMLRGVKRAIINRIKESLVTTERTGGHPSGHGGILEVTNKTRDFVGKHEYEVLAPDPFIVGDSQATELLQIRQLLSDVTRMVDESQEDSETGYLIEDQTEELKTGLVLIPPPPPVVEDELQKESLLKTSLEKNQESHPVREEKGITLPPQISLSVQMATTESSVETVQNLGPDKNLKSSSSSNQPQSSLPQLPLDNNEGMEVGEDLPTAAPQSSPMESQEPHENNNQLQLLEETDPNQDEVDGCDNAPHAQVVDLESSSSTPPNSPVNKETLGPIEEESKSKSSQKEEDKAAEGASPEAKRINSIQLSFNIPRFPVIKNTSPTSTIEKSLKSEVNSFVFPKVPIVKKEINKPFKCLTSCGEVTIASIESQNVPNSSTAISKASSHPSCLSNECSNRQPESSSSSSTLPPSSAYGYLVITKLPLPLDIPRITGTYSVATNNNQNHSQQSITIPPPPPPVQNASDSLLDLDPFLQELLSMPPTKKPRLPSSPRTPFADMNAPHGKAGSVPCEDGKFRQACLCGKTYVSNAKLTRHIQQVALKMGQGSVPQPSNVERVQGNNNQLPGFEKPLDLDRKQGPKSSSDEVPLVDVETISSSVRAPVLSLPPPKNNHNNNGLFKTVDQKNLKVSNLRRFTDAAIAGLPRPQTIAKKRITPPVPQLNRMPIAPTTTATPHDTRRNPAKWYNCGQCLTASNGGVVKRFVSLAALTSHVHSVHGGWKCRMAGCEKRFTTHLAMQKHVVQGQCHLQAFSTSEAQVLKTAPITIPNISTAAAKRRPSVKPKPVVQESDDDVVEIIDDIYDVLEVNLETEEGKKVSLAAEEESDQDIICIDD